MTRPRSVLVCGALAAFAAAVLGTGLFCYGTGHFTLDIYLRLTLVGGFPLALAHAGLAGPPVAQLLIGRRPVDWGSALLAGVVIGMVPTVVLLAVMVPLHAYAGNQVELDEWVIGVAMLAVSGAVGGAVFRYFHGPGPLK